MAKQQIILITGATDGIGLALARLYQARGARLILVGRRPLAMLRDPLFRPDNYCQVDLADGDAAAQILRWLDLRGIYEIHLVIQNAGTAMIGDIETQGNDSIQQLLTVNLYTPIALTHGLLARLLMAKGKVVFIGSAAATVPGPHYAIYTASKAALTGFVRNLQAELETSNVGISVQIIHPGATQTGIHGKAGMAANQTSGYASPESVAKQIERLIATERRSATLGMSNRLVSAFGQHFPATLETIMRRGLPPRTQSGIKHVVITGAAQGIGKALAEQFAQQGYTITGVDVDTKAAMYTQAELINTHGAQVRFALADLGNFNDLNRVVESIAARPPIDVLIHNAGINATGPFGMMNLKQQLTVLDVNLTAPLVITAQLMRQGRFAPGATLTFMSSLSHFVGYPGASVYAASKDGLSAYASSLSVALAPRGLRVLTVYPGPTRTEHARRHSPDNSREAERMPPEELAELLFKAVKRRKRFLIPGRRNKSFALAGTWFPERAESVMQREVYGKMVGQRR